MAYESRLSFSYVLANKDYFFKSMYNFFCFEFILYLLAFIYLTVHSTVIATIAIVNCYFNFILDSAYFYLTTRRLIVEKLKTSTVDVIR